jgi:hypothetical protein
MLLLPAAATAKAVVIQGLVPLICLSIWAAGLVSVLTVKLVMLPGSLGLEQKAV